VLSWHKSVRTTKADVREFGVKVLDEAVEVLLWQKTKLNNS